MLPCNCSGLFALGLWVYVPSQQATHKQFIFDRAFKKLSQKDLLHQWRRVRGTCTQSSIKLTVESGNNSTHISRKKIEQFTTLPCSWEARRGTLWLLKYTLLETLERIPELRICEGQMKRSRHLLGLFITFSLHPKRRSSYNTLGYIPEGF